MEAIRQVDTWKSQNTGDELGVYVKDGILQLAPNGTTGAQHGDAPDRVQPIAFDRAGSTVLAEAFGYELA